MNLRKTNCLTLLFLLPLLTAAQQNIDSIIVDLGFRLDSTLSVGSRDYFMEIFDQEYFLDELSMDTDRDSIQAQVVEEFGKEGIPGQIANSLVAAIRDNGANYDFVNYWEDLRGYYVLFRLFSDDGLNYHQYFIFENDAGEYKIGDLFIFLTGENISETFSSVLQLNRQEGIEESEYERANLIMKFVKVLESKGDLEKAREMYATIPDQIRQLKTYMVFELKIIDNFKDFSEWQKRFESQFPHNPGLALLSIDYLVLEEKYAECLGAVDSLDAYVDDDFLDFYRGNILSMKGDFEKSAQFYIQLIENYPAFFDGYNNLLHVYIEGKKYQEATETLDFFVEYYGYTKKELKNILRSEYPLFYQSDTFSQWMKRK